MAKIGTAYVDIVGNFAPLNKAIAANQGSIKSRMAGIAKAGAFAGAAIGVAAIKSSIDFQHSMTLVRTQAGATQKEVDKLSKSILAFAGSGKTTFAPKELADALFRVESAGIHGAQAMETLKRSSDLAELGQANLEDTTKALVAAQKTGIKGSGDLKKAIGTLNATVGSGQLKLEDLVGALGTGFLAPARAVGLSLTDVGGALAELTKQGSPASAAATRLRLTFLNMAAPTDSAKEALKGIGLTQFQMATAMRSKGGLVSALELLREHMKNLSQNQRVDLLKQAFGGAKSGSTIITLLQNLGDLDETMQHIKTHAGDVDQAMKDVHADPAVRLKEAYVQLQTVLVELGGKIAPAAVDALSGLAKIITSDKLTGEEKFSKITDGLSKAVSDAAPDVAAAAVKVGAGIGKGLLKGFLDADPLGKLFIASALIRIIGGPGALTKTGAAMARPLTTAFTATQTEGMVAGTKAATTAATETMVAGIGAETEAAVAAIKAQGVAIKAAQLAAFPFAGAGGVPITKAPSNAAAAFPFAGMGNQLAKEGETSAASFGSRFKTSISKVQTSLKGTMSKVGSRLGGAMTIGLVSQFAGSAIGGDIGSKLSTVGTGLAVGSLLGPWGALGGALAGAVVAGFQEKSIGSQMASQVESQLQAALPKIQRALDNFNLGFVRKQLKSLQQVRDAMKSVGASDVDLAPLNEQIRQLNDALSGKQADRDKLISGLKFLKHGYGASLGDILKITQRNVKLIDDQLGSGTERGRARLAQNFRLSAKNIARYLGKGSHASKEVKAGMAQIHNLIEKADLIDPSKKQARGFGKSWGEQMTKAKDATSKTVKSIIKKMGEMPDPMRKIAIRIALDQLQQAKRNKDLSGSQYDKLRSKILSTYTDVKDKGHDKMSGFAKDTIHVVTNLVDTVTGAKGFDKLVNETNKMLSQLGVAKNKWVITGGSDHKGKGAQRGMAFDVGGQGSGDKVPVNLMLEPGERGFILNKHAARMQDHLHHLHALNKKFSRFGSAHLGMDAKRQHMAKGGMAAMMAEANRFESRHFPYRWGGGHASFGIQPVDCSGAVSDILHSAGLLRAPMVSGALAHWGKAGVGPLTVYANPVHTFMSLAGKYFGTSSSNPGGGAGWMGDPGAGYRSGFAARTMEVTGAALGAIKRLILKGHPGPLETGGQASLDRVRGAANQYVQKHMPAGAFGGGQGLADFGKGPGKIVGASVYGFGEAGTGTVGASGQDLRGKPAFAELDMGTALGHLPFGAKLSITVGPRTAVGEKLDIGAGGGDVGGHHRAIDFWHDLATKLGLSGSFLGLAKVKGLQRGGDMPPFVGGFDMGGMVPGFPGQEVLGLLHGGEFVQRQDGGPIDPPHGHHYHREARRFAKLLAVLQKELETHLTKEQRKRQQHLQKIDPEDRTKHQKAELARLNALTETHDKLTKKERHELGRLEDHLLTKKHEQELERLAGKKHLTKDEQARLEELRQQKADKRGRRDELEKQQTLHRREEKERKRVEDRIAHLEGRRDDEKELASELKQLRHDIREHNRLYGEIRLSERAALQTLASVISEQQGRGREQIRRSAAAGSATRI